MAAANWPAPWAWASLTASTASRLIGMPIETTSAPPDLSMARREKAAGFSNFVMASSSTHHCGCALDGAHDAHVSTAPAFQALQRGLDLSICRLLLVPQEGGGRHDPAVDAVATLRHLLFHIGGLQWMRLLGRAEAGERHHL